jgi:uncharacterized OsmC-like protein
MKGRTMAEEEKEVVVEYRRDGDDKHILSLDSKALPEIRIDYTGIPKDKRAGTAQSLLAASALYCFASTFGSALAARGATIKSLIGKAVSEKEKDEYYRTKVSNIQIEVEVDLNDADLPTLERCKKIMENGCLITYSLNQGIEVEHNIKQFIE